MAKTSSMLNYLLLNSEAILNTGPLSLDFSEFDILEINGYSFSGTNFNLNRIDGINGAPDVNFQTYDISRGHGMGYYSYFFKKKIFTIQGVLKSSNGISLLDAEKNLKMKMMKGPLLKMKYRYEGEVLTGLVTITNLDIKRDHYHINFAEAKIDCMIIDPFLHSIDTREIDFNGITTDISSSIDNIYGSYAADPIILINFVSATGVNEVIVTINDDYLIYEGNISAGQVLKIDSKLKDVQINSVGGKDYTGTFPTLQLGANTIDIAINGTFNANVNIIWQPNFI